jgi:RNA recognition motif-containing protein
MEDEAAPEAGSKEETDARSVFVNNVDFGTTPEELQQLFAGCGTVNRVTILADKFGTPKVSRCQHAATAVGLHKAQRHLSTVQRG